MTTKDILFFHIILNNKILYLFKFYLHRHCWRKHHRQSAMGNDMISDKSTDPLAENNQEEVSHKVLKE